MKASRSEVLESLARRIREIENAPRQDKATAAVGIAALAELFPKGRLPTGTLVELLAASEGAGVWTLALLLAQPVCAGGKALVIVDVQECFYPPGAARLGVDLERTIVVRPKKRQDAYAAFDQSLRCPGVGAAIGWQQPLGTLDMRRLQLAAEQGGGVGFLLRPKGALGQPSFAALRVLVTPVAAPAGETPNSDVAARRISMDVLRCQEGKAGRSLLLEIDDETGHVRIPAGVASAALGA